MISQHDTQLQFLSAPPYFISSSQRCYEILHNSFKDKFSWTKYIFVFLSFTMVKVFNIFFNNLLIFGLELFRYSSIHKHVLYMYRNCDPTCRGIYPRGSSPRGFDAKIKIKLLKRFSSLQNEKTRLPSVFTFTK